VATEALLTLIAPERDRGIVITIADPRPNGEQVLALHQQDRGGGPAVVLQVRIVATIVDAMAIVERARAELTAVGWREPEGDYWG
jgi:hypothetical protein